MKTLLLTLWCSSTLGLLNFVFVLVFRFIDLRASVDLQFLHLERVDSKLGGGRCRKISCRILENYQSIVTAASCLGNLPMAVSFGVTHGWIPLSVDCSFRGHWYLDIVF
jgi:hypothetical protein